MNRVRLSRPPTPDSRTHPLSPRSFTPLCVFVNKQSGKDVTNCHKLPAYNFDRRIVSVDEIAQALQRSLTNVLRANPDARVLLTVSPVRHWRDGPVENARSKAHLLAGAHAAIEQLRAAGVGEGVGEGGAGRVSYFPSFEIVNDDLRDYRFFESDMVHPNGVAVDYIWDKLVGAMFSDDAIRTMQEVRRNSRVQRGFRDILDRSCV